MREHGTWDVQSAGAAGAGATGTLVFPEGSRLTHLRAQVPAGGGSFTITKAGGLISLVTLPAGTGVVDLYPGGDLAVRSIAYVTMISIIAESVR